VPKNCVPARAALSGSQMTSLFVICRFALRATPGRYWNTPLASTSIHGIV
jgi:hypothetical protein